MACPSVPRLLQGLMLQPLPHQHLGLLLELLPGPWDLLPALLRLRLPLPRLRLPPLPLLAARWPVGWVAQLVPLPSLPLWSEQTGL